MPRISIVRSAGWAGLSTIGLCVFALAFTIPANGWSHPYPLWDDSTESIAHWFSENQTVTIWQALLSNLSMVAMLWFIIVLTGLLKHSDGSVSPFARMMTPLGAIVAATACVCNAFWIIAATTDMSGAHPWPPEMVRYSFEAAVEVWLGGVQMMLGFLLFFAAAAIRSTRRLPAWAGWFAITAGILDLLNPLVLFLDHGPLIPQSWLSVIPYGATWIWFASVSIVLLRQGSKAFSDPVAAPDQVLGPP